MYLSPIKADGSAAASSKSLKRRRTALLALPVAAVLLFGLRSLASDEAKADVPPPPTVSVSRPLQQNIVEWDDYVGRFEASQAVEIRPRVSGALQSIHFRDGEIVHKGQLLFVIDPRPFRAALAEARAREAGAASQLALARDELARANRLIDDQGISQQEVDSRRAAVRSAEAGLAAARAQVAARALDLEFTRIRSPITGRISDRRIDIGNLVGAGAGEGATLLTTVYALDPIYFSFDGSEALYLKARRGREAGEDRAQQVEIKLQDEREYQWKGKVDFTDNGIDAGSGTVRARAVVANPDYFLTPGLFGNMRLSSQAARPALLIPDAAVQSDQARKVVNIVGRDGKVAVKPVELGPRIGTLRAIRSGLAPDDRVIVEGIQFAQPGTKVNLRAKRISPPEAAPAIAAARVPPASQATLASH